jgi:hypothetical protein
MGVFEVTMQGNWTRGWPTQDILLLNVVFHGDENISKGFYSVTITVTAIDEEHAKITARDRIEEICYLYELILGGSMQLNKQNILFKKISDSVLTGESTIGAKVALYDATPPTNQELSLLSTVEGKVISAYWFTRVIRWHGEAKREGDLTDKLLKFFIAYEIFVTNYFGKPRIHGAEQDVINHFASKHPSCDIIKIEDRIKSLRRARNDIMHEGTFVRDQLIVLVSAIESINNDLFSDFLTLSTNSRSEPYFK